MDRRPLWLEPLESRVLLDFNPTAQVQEMLEHINRMRMNPQGELNVLFSSLNPLTARDATANNAIRYFKDPSAEEIQTDWPKLTAAPPLAWHEALDKSATAHTQLMIQHDQQSHQLPGEDPLGTRISKAGYSNWSKVAENVFAFADSVFNAHSAFAIDWAVDDRGHRTNIMNAAYQEVGIGITAESSSSTKVGPLLVTEDFGVRYSSGSAYLLGVVFRDRNGNGRYEAGEGVGGASIQLTGAAGTFSATTMTAGGYQVKAPPGTYTVTASGGGLTTALTQSRVVVGTTNVKVDFDASKTSIPRVLNVTSSSANGAYKAGAVIPVRVEFSEPVIVTGTPTLRLETGATDRSASYASGSNSTVLYFNYRVEPGDGSADLEYTASNALSLSSGAIKGASGNNAVLTLPAPGAAGSLSANKNLVVDTSAPRATSVVPNVTAIGDAMAGAATFSLTVQFSDTMNQSLPPSLTFPRENPGAALVMNTGRSRWTNASTFVAVFDVADTNKSVINLDVAVANAADAAGNVQSAAQWADVFSIDMASPIVKSVTASTRKINAAIVGSATFSLRVVFGEKMDRTVAPVLSFPVENPGSVLKFNARQSGWVDELTYVAKYDVAPVNQKLAKIDVAVASARDAAGNLVVAKKFANKFSIDIRNKKGTGVFSARATSPHPLVSPGSCD